MKRPSIKEVAAKAGVSAALVSYVLNNRHTERINKETAKRIQQVAEELNYQPNKIAQSLKSKKTYTLALVVPDIADPFTSQIIKTVEQEAREKGYAVIIGSSDENAENLQQSLELLRSRMVDGYIIIPVTESKSSIQKLIRMRAPVVLINGYFKEMEVPVIMTNNYGISFQATEYLIEHGKRNIGILACKTGLTHLNERVDGYRAALKKHGLSENIWYIDETRMQEEADKAISEMLSSPDHINALFFTTNKLAISGLKKLNKEEIKTSRQLSILAFDELSVSDTFKTPVISIKKPLYEISRSAVDTVIDMIENEKSKPKHRIHNSKLIIKGFA